jgi:hypothetical protein
MVGHSCWCLLSPWLSLQQKLAGSWWWSCSVFELLMLAREVQLCKSSCITPHGCEVFRGIAEVCQWWHTRSTNLINTSKATKYLVLATAKVWVQGGTRSTSWQSSCWQPKAKLLSTLLSLCRWRGLKMSFWISAPSCAAKLQVYSGYNVQYLDFEGGWDKIVKLWKLWQSDK